MAFEGYLMKLFPAQAGVILGLAELVEMLKAVPRASGGDPLYGTRYWQAADCSPRKRG